MFMFLQTYKISSFIPFSALRILFFLFRSLIKAMDAIVEVRILSSSSALSSNSASFVSSFSTSSWLPSPKDCVQNNISNFCDKKDLRWIWFVWRRPCRIICAPQMQMKTTNYLILLERQGLGNGRQKPWNINRYFISV